MLSSELYSYLFVKTGEPFKISLPSNPTTGYQWNLTSYPPFIRIIGNEYFPDPHTEGMVGTGGMQVFTLVADYAGEGLLHFDYATSWGVYGKSTEVYVFAQNG